mmetsp:Transcript_43885/g.125554  ORF Transcript_43885/g.125554 Transcript_43885/m.125554 type:complete len:243 (+) Transcript_43885:177-905(+)
MMQRRRRDLHAKASHRFSKAVLDKRLARAPWGVTAVQGQRWAGEPACRRSPAETALPLLVAGDDAEQVLTGHLGPVLVEEKHLRVRKLVHQKVAEPALTRCADEDIGVGNVSRQQPSLDRVLVDLLRLQRARGDLPRKRLASMHHIAATAVAHADVQLATRANGGLLLEPSQAGPELRGQRRGVRGQEAHADVELGGQLAESWDFGHEELHHAFHLSRVPLPILSGERENCQIANTLLYTPL